jgi:two-component system, OmpR family, sensor histidine kinase MtrB
VASATRPARHDALIRRRAILLIQRLRRHGRAAPPEPDPPAATVPAVPAALPFDVVPISLGRRVRRLLRRIGTRWRRSLQLRVVATTLVVSAVAVALLGFVVLQQVRSGLLEAKLRSSTSQELNGLSSARNLLSLSSSGNAVIALTNTVKSLSPPDTSRRQPGGYEVAAFEVLSPGVISKSQPAADVGFKVSSIPDKLIESVGTGDAQYYYAYTTMAYTDGVQFPGLAIGSLVSTSTNQQYELYYVFSLQQEEQTLALVGRTLLLSGVGLVALLAGIAWLVTRQVVKPVRMAARIAERLADGRLQERMQPKGEDDLARLAASFNKMAESLQRQIRRLEHLSRVQRRFVSDVSHELRTPVTTIRMAADVLYEARRKFDPASARSVELLQNQI